MNDKEVMNMIHMTKRLWNFILMFIIDIILLIVFAIGLNYQFIPEWLIILTSLLGGGAAIAVINITILLVFDSDDSVDGDDNMEDIY